MVHSIWHLKDCVMFLQAMRGRVPPVSNPVCLSLFAVHTKCVFCRWVGEDAECGKVGSFADDCCHPSCPFADPCHTCQYHDLQSDGTKVYRCSWTSKKTGKLLHFDRYNIESQTSFCSRCQGQRSNSVACYGGSA